MAQNVESNVNIKVHADTGQAQEAISSSMKAFGEFATAIEKINKLNIVSDKQLKEIEDLGNAFINVFEKEELSEKETESLIENFQKYNGILTQIKTNLNDQKLAASAELFGRVREEIENISKTKPVNAVDKDALNIISDVYKRFEELKESVKTFENGDRTFSDRKTALEDIKKGVEAYNKELANIGLTQDFINKRREDEAKKEQEAIQRREIEVQKQQEIIQKQEIAKQQAEEASKNYKAIQQDIAKIAELTPKTVFDEQAANKIAEVNKLYDELSNRIKTFDSGDKTFADRRTLFEELKTAMEQYRTSLDKSGITLDEIAKKQDILKNISSGNIWDTLKGSSVGAQTTSETKKAAEEEQKRQEAINRINKEYAETVRKQQQQEELEKRITAEAEKRARLEEEFNKRREEAQKKQAELQENLNKTYSDLGGGGVSAPNGAFEQSINDLAAQAGSESNASFGELFSNLNISDKLLSAFANKIGISTTELKALGEALGVSAGSLLAYAGAAAVAVGGIKLLIDNTKEMITTFKNVGSAIGESAFDSIEWFVDSLQDMVDMAEQAIKTLDKLAEAGTTIERAFLTTSAYLGQDATDQIYGFIQSISGASNTMFASINDVVAAAGSMGLASDQLVEATENMTVMGRNLGVLIGDTQKAFADLGQTISKGYVGRNSILYRIFTKQEIDQVRKLGSEVERYNFILERAGRVQELYNAYIETASGKVSLMKMQYQELMNNIGLVALNLYAIVAPVLTKILTIANQLLSVLISVFGWEPKSVGFTSIASDIGNSLDNVAESASKANKQLASFDDVIQINDNKSGGGSGVGGIDPQALGDFSGLLDDALGKSDEFVNLWEHFKELMEQGDYFGAGKEFMQVITDQLRNIPWDEIKTKASEAGKAVAEFLNGIFDVSSLDGLLNWRTIGETIAEALNTVITAVGSFLKEFDFKMMGKALGTAWDSLWDNLDIEGAAEALYEAFMGVFEFVNGWLEGGGLSRAAEGIAQFITSLFSNFTIEDTDEIVNAVTGVIDNIINALSIVADALTSDDVKRVVFALITKLVSAFKDNAADWGKSLHDIASDILDFIIEAFETADGAGLLDAILTFLQNLKLDDLLARWLTIKWEIFKIKFLAGFQIFAGTIIDFLLKFLLALVSTVAAGLLLIIAEAWKIGTQLANWLTEGTAWIGEQIGTFIGNIISAVVLFGVNLITKISSIGENIGNKFNEIGAKIEEIFSGVWEFIKSIFDPNTWLELGSKAIDALWGGIKDIWNNTVGSWSFDIPGFEVMGKQWDGIHFSMPKLATGGIVTSATTALIGEAGKEAVLPLDNNTQWMDKLAAKINNNGNNAGGTVRVELSDKPFYTRAEMYEFGALVVESLKAYGLNIAIV